MIVFTCSCHADGGCCSRHVASIDGKRAISDLRVSTRVQLAAVHWGETFAAELHRDIPWSLLEAQRWRREYVLSRCTFDFGMELAQGLVNSCTPAERRCPSTSEFTPCTRIACATKWRIRTHTHVLTVQKSARSAHRAPQQQPAGYFCRLRASSSSRRDRPSEHHDTNPLLSVTATGGRLTRIFPSSIPANNNTPRQKAECTSNVCI